MNIMFILLTLIMCIFFQIETYTNLKKIDQFENSDIYKTYDKLYISFTTIPSRIAYIDEMLKSVDVPEVYEIHLNLQSEFEYPEKEIERLKSITPKLKVFWSTYKLGPMTKSVPTLERLLGTNSLVISVDDDAVYRHEALMNLVTNYNPAVKEILCNFVNVSIVKECDHVLLFGGGAGVLYPTKIITQEMIDKMKEYVINSKFCYKEDDNVMAAVFHKYKIPIRNASILVNTEFLNYSKINSISTSSFVAGFVNSYMYNTINCCADIKKIETK